MPKEKIKVVELTLEQKLTNLKEPGPVETPVDDLVVIETPVDDLVVIETPVDCINTDDDWDHISSDDD
jgi:hypothetical protein